MDKKHAVFIHRSDLIQNPLATERLKTLNKHIEWDPVNQGAWIKRGSTAHNLAIVLGFEPFDNQKPIENGTYDRTGRV